MKWRIKQIGPEDREDITQLAIRSWGSEKMIVHHECFHLAEQPGFLAREGSQILGFLTYRIDQESDAELLSLDSFQENTGIGTTLLARFVQQAESNGSKRIYLTTTNDNIRALQFYQKRGFSLCAFHRNAVSKARRMKPEIPLVAENGIPIAHELELEYVNW